MTKKLNILLIISLALALFTGGLYVYFSNTVNTNKQAASLALLNVNTSKAKLSNLENIAENLKNTVVYGDKISALFVKQENIVDFIQVVEGLMENIGIVGSVDSVTEQTTPELDALGREQLQLAITADGDWSKLVTLLGLLERLPYKSTINSFSLNDQVTTSTDTKGKTQTVAKGWELKVQMVVWVIKAQADAATPAIAPVPPATDDTNDTEN